MSFSDRLHKFSFPARGKAFAGVAFFVAAGMSVSACSTPSLTVKSPGVSNETSSSENTAAVPPPKVTVTPSGKTKTLNTDIVVSTDGLLNRVAVKDKKTGEELKGDVSSSGNEWVSKRDTLDLNRRYVVKVVAVSQEGGVAKIRKVVRTPVPKAISNPVFSGVSNGGTYGVGMPIVLNFDYPVDSKKKRKEVVEKISVTSNKPVVGAWVWSNYNKTLTFRPRSFWPAYSKIRVTTNLKGTELSPRVWADYNANFRMKTGARMVSVVNANTHRMKVFRNGKRISNIPITTGKPGFTTRSGVKVITEKLPFVIMDAASGGTPETSSEYYRLGVKWAMRITNSGEFVHAAPWSVGSQGVANVSHGCVGMNTTAAQTLFRQTNIGDVVEVRGTNRGLEDGNGITVWNVPWKKWKGQSSTGVYVVQRNTEPASSESSESVQPDES